MPYVHNETLLELLMKQAQPGAGVGVRLSFHAKLLEPIGLSNHPYHYAAVTGDTMLALFLRENGLTHCKDPVPIAAFHAGGVNSTTPWKKNLEVSPKDSALIAGHGDTAQALSNLSAGVPLNWTRDNHRQWPAALKQAGAQLVAGLAGAPWFHALPGAARCAVVDACMQQVAQQTVWPMVPERFWSEGFAPLVPLPLMIAARDVAERGVTGVDQPWRGADGGALGAPDAGMGGLQFIVTRPRRGWAHALSGAAKLLARCATTVFGITQLCNITQHAPGHLKLAVVLLIATQVMTTGSGGRRR